MSKPQTQGLRGAKTLYDELQSLHIYQWEIAHEVVRCSEVIYLQTLLG